MSERFRQETLDAMQVQDIPALADFQDVGSWNAVCRQIFERADAAQIVIGHRYQAILDSRATGSPRPLEPKGLVIKGHRHARGKPLSNGWICYRLTLCGGY
jgi:hypothetical protein